MGGVYQQDLEGTLVLEIRKFNTIHIKELFFSNGLNISDKKE